ncbi:MAG: nitrite/sulfite reductase [Archaeoglobus sp.]|nr:nitrite/sulfite reductase [Archaeoglobus sp.]
MIELDVDFLSKFIGRYSLGKENGNGSTHFLRIKIPGGVLKHKNLIEIAELADEFGRGYAEITTRQDIQLHWINPDEAIEIFERLYRMGFTTDLCGQAFRETCHGDVRNIVCCPLMGKTGPNFSQPAIEIDNFFSGKSEYITLPHKFKIALTACGNDCIKLHANDLSLFWMGGGFIPFFVGGGMGASLPGVRVAEPMGIKIPAERVFDFVKAVVDVHKKFSNIESKAKARFKFLVHEWGVERLRKKIEEITGTFPEISEEVKLGEMGIEHTHGIQKNGRYFFTLPVLGGVLDSDKLRQIADLSRRYGDGEIRLTPWQNVVLVDIDAEDLEALKDELKGNFNLKTPYRAVGCASDFCGRTVVHSKQVLKDITQNLPLNLSVAVSGCGNACSCHPLADIGLVGRVKRQKQVYDIYVRGRLFKKDVVPNLITSCLKEGLYEVKA